MYIYFYNGMQFGLRVFTEMRQSDRFQEMKQEYHFPL